MISTVILSDVPTAWLEVIFYVLTTAVGVFVNYLLVTARVKRKLDEQSAVYRDRVDRLTGEVNRYEDKVEALERKFAALTGQANGFYRKEGD